MKSASGTYILIIQTHVNLTLSIGALGEIKFLRGYYAYIGSAMNQQLFNRVKRHLKPKNKKKLHWHIDYLLFHSSASIFKIYLIPSNRKEECEIAREISNHAVRFVPYFGSSDCNCKSHLYYLSNNCTLIQS